MVKFANKYMALALILVLGIGLSACTIAEDSPQDPVETPQVEKILADVSITSSCEIIPPESKVPGTHEITVNLSNVEDISILVNDLEITDYVLEDSTATFAIVTTDADIDKEYKVIVEILGPSSASCEASFTITEPQAEEAEEAEDTEAANLQCVPGHYDNESDSCVCEGNGIISIEDGKCSCDEANGFLLVGVDCVCDNAENYFDLGNNKCETVICGLGGEYNSIINICECPAGTTNSEDGLSCICGTGAIPTADEKCQCDTDNGYILDGVECICNEAENYFDLGNNKCEVVICGLGVEYNSIKDRCECPAGTIKSEDSLSCSCDEDAGYYFVESEDECEQKDCGLGEVVYNSTSTALKCKCLTPTILDPESDKCVPDESLGYIPVDNDVGYICDSGKNLKNTSAGCECKDDYILTDDGISCERVIENIRVTLHTPVEDRNGEIRISFGASSSNIYIDELLFEKVEYGNNT
ncbi:hypothetical protein KKA47_07490, partial [bacterium]|nr:hypothetical protein [bacterium]